MLIVDDHEESRQAQAVLRSDSVVLSIHALCELDWVLRRLYKNSRSEVIEIIQALTETQGIVTDSETVHAGLSFLSSGGDFADGVIEHDGRRLGGQVFTTFDKRAAAIIRRSGRSVNLLGRA
ncbi:putative nucleic-acid-binding protein [Rhizobium sp. PP-F2F-G20b]|nr:putative nucleic-acid-binding protein [Rhizobium sp. PP-F2F-G20b]